MIEQVQEVVRKNLPAEVGEQLRKLLAEGESKGRRLEVAEADLKEHRIRLEARDAKIKELEDRLKVAGDLSKREEEVTKRENAQAVFAADLRAQAANDKANAVLELVRTACRNPVIVRTHTDSESIPPSQSNNWQYQNKTKTTTETEETNPPSVPM